MNSRALKSEPVSARTDRLVRGGCQCQKTVQGTPGSYETYPRKGSECSVRRFGRPNLEGSSAFRLARAASTHATPSRAVRPGLGECSGDWGGVARRLFRKIIGAVRILQS